MSDDTSSKTLIVYVNNSFYKYYELYKTNIYEITELGHIIVYERSRFSGEENVRARFKNWDYFIIE